MTVLKTASEAWRSAGWWPRRRGAVGIKSSLVSAIRPISVCISLNTKDSAVTPGLWHPSETFSRLSLLLIIMFEVIDGQFIVVYSQGNILQLLHRKNCSTILLWFLIIHIRNNSVKCWRSGRDLMCSYDGENHSQISCWAHMVISVFEYACKCLIQCWRETRGWENTKKEIKKRSPPSSHFAFSTWRVCCTQSYRSHWNNYWSRDFHPCVQVSRHPAVPITPGRHSVPAWTKSWDKSWFCFVHMSSFCPHPEWATRFWICLLLQTSLTSFLERAWPTQCLYSAGIFTLALLFYIRHCNWRSFNFTFLDKRIFRCLIRKQVI